MKDFMPNIHLVNDINHPSLDPYRDLKRTSAIRNDNTFIAEGRLVVERLLASDFEVESVLVSGARLQRIESKIPDGVPTPQITAPDNLGAIIRLAAAFQIDGVESSRKTAPFLYW